MKTIKLTTNEIYRNFMASVEDIIWEEGQATSHMHQINAVASKDIDRIRQMFKEGYTAMMVGGKAMEELEASDTDWNNGEVEIRVYDTEQKLLGVIIASEIYY